MRVNNKITNSKLNYKRFQCIDYFYSNYSIENLL